MNKNEAFYLLSLKYSHPRDLLLTFWRANSRGYTFDAEQFGKYGQREGNILASGGIVPAVKVVPAAIVERFFSPVLDHAGRLFKGVPVTEGALSAFGIQASDLQARHADDWTGMELCLDPHSGQVGQIHTTHGLEFLVAKHPERIGWMYFRVGTIVGLYRIQAEAIEISRIDNSEPGNGHLEDMFQHFEHAVKDTGRMLRLVDVTNLDFEQHLIGKRGFKPADHEGKLVLMKRVGVTMKIQPVKWLDPDGAAALRSQDRPTANPL